MANSDEVANVTISILDYVDVDNQDTMSGWVGGRRVVAEVTKPVEYNLRTSPFQNL